MYSPATVVDLELPQVYFPYFSCMQVEMVANLVNIEQVGTLFLLLCWYWLGIPPLPNFAPMCPYNQVYMAEITVSASLSQISTAFVYL